MRTSPLRLTSRTVGNRRVQPARADGLTFPAKGQSGYRKYRALAATEGPKLSSLLGGYMPSSPVVAFLQDFKLEEAYPTLTSTQHVQFLFSNPCQPLVAMCKHSNANLGARLQKLQAQDP